MRHAGNGGDKHHLMAEAAHKRDRRVVVTRLKNDMIRHQLVVEARFGQNLGRRQALVYRSNNVLRRRRRDEAAPRGPGSHEQRPVRTQHHGRRHGRKWPFPRLYKICTRGNVPKRLGGVWPREICADLALARHHYVFVLLDTVHTIQLII